MAPTLKPQRPTPITERAPRAKNESHTHDWKDIKNKPLGGAVTLGGRGVAITTVAGAQGSDTSTNVGGATLPGVQVGDLILIAFPNRSLWTAAERTNTWIAYVDAPDHVMLDVQNNTGGAKAWPADTFTLWKA